VLQFTFTFTLLYLCPGTFSMAHIGLICFTNLFCCNRSQLAHRQCFGLRIEEQAWERRMRTNQQILWTAHCCHFLRST
jgi:hypothetical protein